MGYAHDHAIPEAAVRLDNYVDLHVCVAADMVHAEFRASDISGLHGLPHDDSSAE
jgi:hypothetical protein